jgi:hypothetical protein
MFDQSLGKRLLRVRRPRAELRESIDGVTRKVKP